MVKWGGAVGGRVARGGGLDCVRGMKSGLLRMVKIVGAVLTGLALTGCATHLGKPEGEAPARLRTAFSVEREVVYSPAGWPVELRGDFYRPEVEGLSPAVVLVHGGGWQGPDRRWHMRGIAEDLARRGYGVLNVTYRMAPEWRHPAAVEDLRAAVAWLREDAEGKGVDAERVAVFGYSAGGHLALLVGLMDGPPEARVAAVVAGGAPADLRLYGDGRLLTDYLGGKQAERAAEYAQASPVTHASAGDPPVFLYHARWDKVVPPEHAEAMAVALAAAGVRHELFWLGGGRGHVTSLLLGGDAERAAMEFLDRELRAVEKMDAKSPGTGLR